MRALFRVKETGGKIASLTISGHGAPSRIHIGTEWLDLDSLEKWRPVLMMLRPHFAPDGYVTIQGCKCSGTTDLLTALSNLWGVRVQAWTGDINIFKWGAIDYMSHEGDRIVCLYNMYKTNPSDSMPSRDPNQPMYPILQGYFP